ncbi:hypothetical protein VST7929_02892 [Vibrio stylophorae]|uniref:PTS EIIB type-2 domain-containing protein n=1 Tax=Vibrio stylophorae TaxID=659351 RepID=A0ABM8ZX44_9VIBR|nr:PTS sugar transporter subunit IIB [Vibrio stylophorae]CAH0535254.1 hypothetical protein VST7929_02892 [Vibrio stylophorae]
MKKILAVCGLGMGSSLILRMNIESVLRELGIDADVAHMDVSAAKTAQADLIVTNAEFIKALQGTECQLVEVNNYIDCAEIKDALRSAGL